MDKNISKGVLEKIFLHQFKNPAVIQILQLKRIVGPRVYYRVIVSDSVHSYENAIVSKSFELLNNNSINIYSLVLIMEYTVKATPTSPTRQVLDITKLKLVQHCNSTIGLPVKFCHQETAMISSSNTDTNPPTTNHRTMSINNLSVGLDKWCICGTVAKMLKVKPWFRGEVKGTVFSFVLEDKTGQVFVSAFNQDATQYSKMLKVGRTYSISNGRVQDSNRKFTYVDNSIEIVIKRDTLIVASSESHQPLVPTSNYSKLVDIWGKNFETLVSVIGFVNGDDIITKVIKGKNGMPIKKQEFKLADREKEITVTIWENAKFLSIEREEIVSLQDVKVTAFAGRSLTVLSTSTIVVNPKNEEAKFLKKWKENV